MIYVMLQRKQKILIKFVLLNQSPQSLWRIKNDFRRPCLNVVSWNRKLWALFITLKWWLPHWKGVNIVFWNLFGILGASQRPFFEFSSLFCFGSQAVRLQLQKCLLDEDTPNVFILGQTLQLEANVFGQNTKQTFSLKHHFPGMSADYSDGTSFFQESDSWLTLSIVRQIDVIPSTEGKWLLICAGVEGVSSSKLLGHLTSQRQHTEMMTISPP